MGVANKLFSTNSLYSINVLIYTVQIKITSFTITTNLSQKSPPEDFMKQARGQCTVTFTFPRDVRLSLTEIS